MNWGDYKTYILVPYNGHSSVIRHMLQSLVSAHRASCGYCALSLQPCLCNPHGGNERCLHLCLLKTLRSSLMSGILCQPCYNSYMVLSETILLVSQSRDYIQQKIEETLKIHSLVRYSINDWLISDSRLGRYRLAYLDHLAHLTWLIWAYLAYMSACEYH